MRAKLFTRSGELAGEHTFADEASIGRHASNTITLPVGFVSSRHARIYLDRERECFMIEDLGSRNGTRVDGVRVRRPERLERLSVVTLGERADFVFQVLDEAASASSGGAVAGRAARDASPEEKTVVEAGGAVPEGIGARRGGAPAEPAGDETVIDTGGALPGGLAGGRGGAPAEPAGDETVIDTGGALPGGLAGGRGGAPAEPAGDETVIDTGGALPGGLAGGRGGAPAEPAGDETVIDTGGALPGKLGGGRGGAPAEPAGDETVIDTGGALPGKLGGGRGGAPAEPTGDETVVDMGGGLPGSLGAAHDRAPRQARVLLEIRTAAGDVISHEVGQGRHEIGRARDADLRIEEKSVSRRHAIIEVSGETVTLSDAGSSLGTFIGGERISKPVPIRGVVEIRFGNVAAHCTVQLD
ncbi:MAG: FHA domain-containing protein [Candidatus Eiseniibacteriota bacterium]|jgi:pSer/pThr/pTyr-binding forkhead associated (FHA) protein